MSRQLQALQPFVTHLLPPTRAVRLTEVTVEPEAVCLQLTTTAAAARCPRCAVPSSSVHSRYQRHLTDLPWGTRPVRIQLTVRKFVCRNPSCTRRIFTERVPELVAAYARKTPRLIAALQAIGVALGGQAGARLRMRLGLPTSRDTLLRLVRRLPCRSSRRCGPLVSMTGPTGSASAMARSWWTWSVGGRWRCSTTARRTHWPLGYARIPGSPSSPEIA